MLQQPDANIHGMDFQKFLRNTTRRTASVGCQQRWHRHITNYQQIGHRVSRTSPTQTKVRNPLPQNGRVRLSNRLLHRLQ
jgi:hypothetical protein